MNIFINGKEHQYNDDVSLLDIMKELNIPHKRTAVIINEEVISKNSYQNVKLKNGDKIDFIVLASGG